MHCTDAQMRSTIPQKAVFALCMLAILLILISIPAYADSFFATVPSSQIQACRCATVLNPITVIADSILAQTSYAVSIQGIDPSWHSLTNPLFTLQPGEHAQSDEFITIPCTAAPGTYRQRAVITSSSGEERYLDQDIIVRTCSSLSIEAASSATSANPCETGIFEVRLTNSQTFVDTFDLFVKSPVPAQLSETTVRLEPQKDAIVYIYTRPSCDVYGTYQLSLQATSRSTQTKYSLSPLVLYIPQAYDFDLYATQDTTTIVDPSPISVPLNICKGQTTQAYLYLQNNNAFSNTYYLSSSSPPWVLAPEGAVTLAPSQQAFIPFTISPPAYDPQAALGKELQAGSYTITMRAKSALGSVQKETTLPLQVEDCSRPVIAQKTYLVDAATTRIEIPITNTGSRITTYTVTMPLAPSSFILKTPMITLNPSEQNTIFIDISEAPALKGKYKTTLQLKEASGTTFTYALLVRTPSRVSPYTLLGFIFGAAILILLIILAVLVVRKAAKNKQRPYEHDWTAYTDIKPSARPAEPMMPQGKTQERKETPAQSARSAAPEPKKMLREKAEKTDKKKQTQPGKKTERKPLSPLYIILLILALLAGAAIIIAALYPYLTTPLSVNVSTSENVTDTNESITPTPSPTKTPLVQTPTRTPVTPLSTNTPIPKNASAANMTNMPLNATGAAKVWQMLSSEEYGGGIPLYYYILAGIIVLLAIILITLLRGRNQRSSKKKLEEKKTAAVPYKESKELLMLKREKEKIKAQIQAMRKEQKKAAKKVKEKARRTLGWLLPFILFLLLTAILISGIYFSEYLTFPPSNTTSSISGFNNTNATAGAATPVPATPIPSTPSLTPSPTATAPPVQNATKSPVQALPDEENATPTLTPTPTPFDFSGYNCLFTLASGGSSTITLDDYFTDPDDDPLTFSITTKPSTINATITQGILTLQSPPGFVGVDTLSINAADNKGASIDSGEVTVCIGVRPAFSWGALQPTIDLIVAYLLYIIVGVVLLIIVLVMLSKSSKK